MHIDLMDLRLFLRVVENGSITAGARSAGLALASASARISGLEAQAGTRLLERGRRGTQPTEAGIVLAQHARAVVQQMERMRGDLGAFAAGLRGRVRIAANTAGMIDILPEALAAFVSAHPSVDLDLAEMSSLDVVRAVALATADIGIAADHVDMSGLERDHFHDDRLMLAVPAGHALAHRERIAFAEALAFDFVGLAHDSALQRHLADLAQREGKHMRMRARVGSFDLLCRMVGAEAGLAIVPAAAVARHGGDFRFEAIALTDPWATRRLHLVTRRRNALTVHAERLYAHLSKIGDPARREAATPNL